MESLKFTQKKPFLITVFIRTIKSLCSCQMINYVEDYEIYYKSDISQNHEFKTQSQVLRMDSIYNSDSSLVKIDTIQKMEISNVNYLTCSHSTKEQIKLKYPGWDSVLTENEPKGYHYGKTSNIAQSTLIIPILIGQEIILDHCIFQLREEVIALNPKLVCIKK